MKKFTVNVKIDRPIGYKDKFGTVYPVNYGFVEGVIAGDGEEQDVYIISKEINEELVVFEGEVVAVIYRKDDMEDKWVATKIGEKLSRKEIKKSVEFLEQYFDSEIKMLEWLFSLSFYQIIALLFSLRS